MTDQAVEQWNGADTLRESLVPIDSLQPFPGNPRIGNVAVVRGSLERFGQVKPVVVQEGRIIAGHHVVAAARELGWGEVAVVEHDFGGEDEQRAFLLADNRSSDLGSYETELLAEHLRALAEVDGLDGTGYSTDDLDDLLAAIHRAQMPDATPEPPEPMRRSEMREVVLLYSEDQLAQFETWLKIVAHEKQTGGASETVYAALEVAALTLNQGA